LRRRLFVNNGFEPFFAAPEPNIRTVFSNIPAGLGLDPTETPEAGLRTILEKLIILPKGTDYFT
jgi:hypothetical protein